MNISKAFTSIGIFLTFLLVASSLKAQCPTCPTDIAPTGGGWGGFLPATGCPIEVNFPDGCTFYVCYCWRRLPGYPISGTTTIQTVVTSIDSVKGCADDSTTQSILDYVSNAVNNDVVQYLGTDSIPRCGGSTAYQKLESRLPACMQVDSGTSHKRFTGCHNTAHAYCVQTCDLCLSGTGSGARISRINCTYALFGTPDCGGGNAPTKIKDWIIGRCFQIPCGTGE